jgi:hypothetical protein
VPKFSLLIQRATGTGRRTSLIKPHLNKIELSFFQEFTGLLDIFLVLLKSLVGMRLEEQKAELAKKAVRI